MRVVFNAPPGWPVPEPGWLPPVGWRPDPAWPAPPDGWVFYLPEAQEALARALRVRGAQQLVAGCSLLGLALALTAAASLLWSWAGGMAFPVLALGLGGAGVAVYGGVVMAASERQAERLLRKVPCVLVPLTSSAPHRRPA